MAIDFSYPSWLKPSTEPWQVIAQTGQIIGNALARQRQFQLQAQQVAQENVLRMQEMDFRQRQMTILNQARLQGIEEQKANLSDVPLLNAYAKDPSQPMPAFRSPKSFAVARDIAAAHAQTQLGLQTKADMVDFNNRLAKVDARDRVAITDLQRQGAPATQVWDALSVAESKQREVMREEREFAPDALQKAVDYAREMEKLGDKKVAELAWERAATIARGGKLTGNKDAPTQIAGEKKESFLNRVKEFFGFGAPTGTTNAPSSAAAPGGAPVAATAALPQGMTAAQAIEQANAAIRAGAPRQAVMERLKNWGVAVEEGGGQTVPTQDVQDAISQMVRDALESKPISP